MPLEPLSDLCAVDARCRVLLASRRSLLVYDVAKNCELFRYSMSLLAPCVGPFAHVAWLGNTVVTLDPNGARVWSLKCDIARAVAPLIAPDTETAPFTAVGFLDKSTVVLGDALGRVRALPVKSAPAMLPLDDWREAYYASRATESESVDT